MTKFVHMCQECGKPRPHLSNVRVVPNMIPYTPEQTAAFVRFIEKHRINVDAIKPAKGKCITHAKDIAILKKRVVGIIIKMGIKVL